MDFVICLAYVCEYLQIIENRVIVVLQVMLITLSNRLIKALIVVKLLTEDNPALHCLLVLFMVSFGSLAFETAAKLSETGRLQRLRFLK